MDGIRFILGIHAHQPVGNLPEVFAEAHRRSYLPFLEILSEFPQIPFSLHISGVLFDWLEETHPAYLDRLAALVARGQVELLTGAYYEPILAAIPDADKLGQIRRMTTYLRRRFGVTPKGMWLAERVWEPHLAKPIAEAGVEYVILDDNHFKAAGLPDSALTGRFLTEEQGATLALFPISQRLRYLIPFQEPAATVAYLRERAALAPGGLAIMADDAEKFGGWPGTHDWVYQRGWLKRFLQALLENDEWLHLTTFDRTLAEPPCGRVYLPATSYTEMTEWALPTDACFAFEEAGTQVAALPQAERIRPFLRGGFWRNFLTKYPEANTLHKKMLRLSQRVHALPPKGPQVRAALQGLWRGQCNDAYWHGVFGGLYLPHLRHAAFQHLIRAERALQPSRRDSPPVRVEILDWDADGQDEILMESPHLALVVEPARGGTVVELDARAKAFNLGNTLTRRPEAYHRKLTQAVRREGDAAATIHEARGAKEEGLTDLLHYDAYRRGCFVDHWLPADARLAGFAREGGRADYALTRYRAAVGSAGDQPVVDLSASRQQDDASLTVRKRLILCPDVPRLRVEYRLEGEGIRLPGRFGVELNLAFYMGPPPERTVEINGEPPSDPSLFAVAEADAVREVRIADAWLGLAARLELDPPARLWRTPVQTISQSEEGYERVAQQIALLPHWVLGGREKVRKLRLSLTLESWEAAGG
ncbi:MAG TPA: alpha-amylase/4-alpha-glucanotransferase domain-containing protein [Candidatus Methylomirabilis sp.]|nr:alpha-amylase/4-alpha-glucanotransferase domain-containing protein [Candidatus Methylomirabilis sp.]